MDILAKSKKPNDQQRRQEISVSIGNKWRGNDVEIFVHDEELAARCRRRDERRKTDESITNIQFPFHYSPPVLGQCLTYKHERLRLCPWRVSQVQGRRRQVGGFI